MQNHRKQWDFEISYFTLYYYHIIVAAFSMLTREWSSENCSRVVLVTMAIYLVIKAAAALLIKTFISSPWHTEFVSTCAELLVHVNRSKQSSSSCTMSDPSPWQQSVWCWSLFLLRLYTLVFIFSSVSGVLGVYCSSCDLEWSGICSSWSLSVVRANWRFW